MDTTIDWEAFKPHRPQREGDGQMAVLSRMGDTKTIWDPESPDEVTAAKAQFIALQKKGFVAFKVKGKNGDKGEQIREFDPTAGSIIMAPQVSGGL